LSLIVVLRLSHFSRGWAGRNVDKVLVKTESGSTNCSCWPNTCSTQCYCCRNWFTVMFLPQQKESCGSKITKRDTQCILLWPVVINKALVQQKQN